MSPRLPYERLLLSSEVAELWNVHQHTVTRWALEGRLPYRRTLGGHYRFPARAIRQLLDEAFDPEVADAAEVVRRLGGGR